MNAEDGTPRVEVQIQDGQDESKTPMNKKLSQSNTVSNSRSNSRDRRGLAGKGVNKMFTNSSLTLNMTSTNRYDRNAANANFYFATQTQCKLLSD